MKPKVLSQYSDAVIDGVKVTEVDVDRPNTRAKLKGNKLLIQWGADAASADFKAAQRLRFVRWAKNHLTKKAERIKGREGWHRAMIGNHSIYDVQGKDEVKQNPGSGKTLK